MNGSDEPTPSDPAAETTRLDRIEARLAALEDRIAGAGAALPPPREPSAEPAAAPDDGMQPGLSPAFTASLNDFLRNNPVLSLIGAIVVLVLLSHLIS